MQRRYTAIALSALATIIATPAIAQGFATDFNIDPYTLTIREDNLGSDMDGITLNADGTSLDLRASSTPDNRGKIQFNAVRETEITQLSTTATLSSESIVTDIDGRAAINMGAYFFNDIQEGGIGDDERFGDSQIYLSFYTQASGSSVVEACFERRNEDGSKSAIPGTDAESGGRCQLLVEDVTLDEPHSMSIGYDKDAGTVFAKFDDKTAEYTLVTEHFAAASPRSEIEVRAEGLGTTAAASISSISSNIFNADNLSFLTGEPIYREPSSADDVWVVDGKLRVAVTGTEAGVRETNRRFRVLGETAYVESKMMLSSESTLDGEGFTSMRLRNSFYHETQDDGFGENDATGEVFAAINLYMNDAGEVAADLNISRADSPDWAELTLLRNEGDPEYPVLKEGLALDTEYLGSIELDKEGKRLVFKFEDAEYVYDITTDIYRASFLNGAGVDARIRGLGQSVIFADDFRTDPNAKTAEELAAGGGAGNGGTTATSGSGSGGGCSIHASGGTSLPLVTFLMLLVFATRSWIRRRVK